MLQDIARTLQFYKSSAFNADGGYIVHGPDPQKSLFGTIRGGKA